jgi:8-oxo-dGTP pyrophosphatase MutT (NUDIX family)
MGAGILPTAIHKNKLYFLFGKENKYEDSAPGFSDFGGGTDNTETFFETAVREAGEELTGFLGDDNDIRGLLKKHGTYNIDYSSKGHKPYRMHIFPYKFEPLLPFYYNNNQKFIQKKLDPNIIQKTKIFEKEEIRWICVDDIQKMKPQFRSYFQNIIDMIFTQREKIKQFIKKSLKNKTKKLLIKKNKTKRK